MSALYNWCLYQSLFWSLPSEFKYEDPHYLSYGNVDPRNENRHYLRDAEGLPEDDLDHLVHNYGSACRYPYSGVILGTTPDKESIKSTYVYPPIITDGGVLDRLGNTNLPAYNFNIHPLQEVDYKSSGRSINAYKTSTSDARNKYYHLLLSDRLFKLYPYGTSPKWSTYVLYYTPTRKEWNPCDLVCTTDKYIAGCCKGTYRLHKYLHDTLVMILMNEHWELVLTDDPYMQGILEMICSEFNLNLRVEVFNPTVVDRLNINNVPLSCAICTDSSHFDLLDGMYVECGSVLAISASNKDYVRGISNHFQGRNINTLPVTLFGVYS